MKPMMIASIVILGLTAGVFAAETSEEKIRRLEAENRMLRAQVRTLKEKLAENGATTAPAPRRLVPVAANPKGTVIVKLPENEKRWWSDLPAFVKHVRLRSVIGADYPMQSLTAWLERNKKFENTQVRWRVVVRSARKISAEEAQRDHSRAKAMLARARQNLAGYLKSRGSGKQLKQERAKCRDEVLRLDRQATTCEALANAGGGASVWAAETEGHTMPTLLVQTIVLGDTNVVRGLKITVEGKVTDARVRDPKRRADGVLSFEVHPCKKNARAG